MFKANISGLRIDHLISQSTFKPQKINFIIDLLGVKNAVGAHFGAAEKKFWGGYDVIYVFYILDREEII